MFSIYAFYSTVCLIEALSSGNDDTPSTTAYISINGTKTNYPGTGFNLVELNKSSCSASRASTYNTNGYNSVADSMAAYIRNLTLSTVLIGVTSVDVQQSLTTNARNALLSIGVDVTALQFQGKVVFVAPIGQRNATVTQVGPKGGANLLMKVLVRGEQNPNLFFGNNSTVNSIIIFNPTELAIET